MTRVDTVSVARVACFVATSCLANGCVPNWFLGAMLRVPAVTIPTHEPPRVAGLDDRLQLSEAEQSRLDWLRRVRVPGAVLLHCPSAYAEEIAGDGLFYFNGCGRIAVLECRAPDARGAAMCRRPGTAWPEPGVTLEALSIGAAE